MSSFSYLWLCRWKERILSLRTERELKHECDDLHAIDRLLYLLHQDDTAHVRVTNVYFLPA